MWPCVILLIHSQIPMCLKHWCYKWSQHVISVSLCIQRSVIKMQGCLVSVWNSCPDHNTTSAPTVDFMYAASSISLTSSPTHMYTPSVRDKFKRDSSENRTSCHRWRVQGKCSLAHSNRWRWWRWVSIGYLNGRRARRPFSLRRRRTVWAAIRGL